MRADALAQATGYRPPAWPDMIRLMHDARARWSIPEALASRQTAPV
jgi:dTDP-4-dehydrorhamnose reductase